MKPRKTRQPGVWVVETRKPGSNWWAISMHPERASALVALTAVARGSDYEHRVSRYVRATR